MVLLTLRQLRDRAAGCPPGLWLAVLGIGAAAVLMWHEWANTKHPDEAWLDPEQPALMLDAPTGASPLRARQRTYPATLSGWSCSKVGDC